MADRITNADCRRVLALVAKGTHIATTPRPNEAVTTDNWCIRVGGWPHAPSQWSRGFMIGDYLRQERGHVGPRHDDRGLYEGRGWHERMAVDILDALAGLRTAANEDRQRQAALQEAYDLVEDP